MPPRPHASYATTPGAPLEVAALVAVAWPDNLGSQRVLEKLGFTFRGIEAHYGRATRVYVLARPGR